MLTDLEPTILTRKPLIVPLQPRSHRNWTAPGRTVSTQAARQLLQARRDSLRAIRAENMVWIGLAICALAVLALSLCF